MMAPTAAAAVALALFAQQTPAAYRQSIETWRKQREARLQAPDGWLSVAGLFWLHDGENPAGSAPGADVALPERAPARAGVFVFRGGRVEFRPAPGVNALLNGKPLAGGAVVRDDMSGSPDTLRIGDLTLLVIKRGDKFGIRLKDPQSEMRKNFHGLKWYPVRESYRIVAKFVSYDHPKKVAVPNILGQTDQESSPGYAVFTLKGHEYRLDPTVEEGQLFFVFRDTTSAKTTYGAGRFLYADMPREGKVVLDFNKAYNPPCAFTPYATCPLPPRQNRLPVAIEAGELRYGEH